MYIVNGGTRKIGGGGGGGGGGGDLDPALYSLYLRERMCDLQSSRIYHITDPELNYVFFCYNLFKHQKFVRTSV